ncbi:MAG: hypothetical protein J7J46_10195 [Candidatus Desulfofervidus sp.]|nr:hypothetical protein [Candidatus Desulfofervidus sp.]
MKNLEEKLLNKLYKSHQGESGFPFINKKEFKELVKKAHSVLINVAKNKSLITYGEVGSKIGLNPGSEWFQLKIAAIVGACSEYENAKGRPLLSSIVVNQETRKPGLGYWGLQGIPLHLQKEIRIWSTEAEEVWNEPERIEFWASEVNKVYKYWASHDL